jgi:hypothetical protein
MPVGFCRQNRIERGRHFHEEARRAYQQNHGTDHAPEQPGLFVGRAF